MSNNNTLQEFLQKHPDTELVEMILPDICGGLRGKWVTREKFDKLMGGQLKMPLSSLVCECWAATARPGFSVRAMATVIVSPMAAPWCRCPGRTAPWRRCWCRCSEIDGAPCAYDSRHILTGLMARFAALGLTPVVATEMEFYLLREGG